MNFDQAKALRLQQWRSTLDDHDFRMQYPEAHRQTLHAMSATLVAEGLIDTLQLFDLNEMANAAYWHAVEELHSAPVRYCGASSYDVVQCGRPELYGKIGRSIFYTASTLADSARCSYDGKIYQDATGANLVLNPSGEVARINGLTLTLPDGSYATLWKPGERSRAWPLSRLKIRTSIVRWWTSLKWRRNAVTCSSSNDCGRFWT